MTGQVVFGKDYFPRPKDEARIWRKIKRGGHLLVLAPRRVGKTSLLRHLENNPENGFVFLYVMVQSCKTEHEFYKEIFEKLLSSEFTDRLDKLMQRGKEMIFGLIQKVKSIKYGETGITFENKDDKLTAVDLEQVIYKLNLEHKLIIVLDEYPDVLEKIDKLEGHQAALDFLATTRRLCQNTKLSEKVQFIFTGSIGLDTLAHRLGSTSLINDREKVSIDPLSKDDGIKFIEFLQQKNESALSLSEPIAQYLLQKVEWLMPYYIESLWERLEDYCLDNNKCNPTQQEVDAAFELLFHTNYRTTFNHWAERLQRFETSEAKLAKCILDQLATLGELSFSEIYNFFQESPFEGVNGNYVLDCLEHDGYVFEYKDKSFKFSSPILKEWWRRYADRTL